MDKSGSKAMDVKDCITDQQKEELKVLIKDKVHESFGVDDNLDFLIDWIYSLAVEQNQPRDEILTQMMTTIDNKEVAEKLTNQIIDEIAPKFRKTTPVTTAKPQIKQISLQKKRDIKTDSKKKQGDDQDLQQRKPDILERISRKDKEILPKKRVHQNSHYLDMDLKTIIQNEKGQKTTHQVSIEKRIVKSNNNVKKFDRIVEQPTTQKSEKNLGLSTDDARQKRMQRFNTGGPKDQNETSYKATAENTQKRINLKQEIGEQNPSKKQVRCRHFPNCTNNQCPFVHPSEECKYFPACSNGDRCLFIHPEIECKFGLSCTRQNCAYKHPKGKVTGVGKMGGMNQMAMQMMMLMAQSKQMHRPRAPLNYQKKIPQQAPEVQKMD